MLWNILKGDLSKVTGTVSEMERGILRGPVRCVGALSTGAFFLTPRLSRSTYRVVQLEVFMSHVHELHRRGVIHRDVRSENVIVPANNSGPPVRGPWGPGMLAAHRGVPGGR
ncbi:hypothetical protein CALCODRAFT_261719 [Calocera cornea HHB12733]|uniref:Uncharacterized protein n=1 Tax=Calocera cornea HHB12733 TaxID=1353952 RepID=A0A165GEM2_9BASI|nr:hypothetical protein CALCODRAFT_261719 [Calocera cornea HHB12733]